MAMGGDAAGDSSGGGAGMADPGIAGGSAALVGAEARAIGTSQLALGLRARMVARRNADSPGLYRLSADAGITTSKSHPLP